MSISLRLTAAALSFGILLGSGAAGAAITHTTHNLHLRSGPAVSYAPISVIPSGAAIDVLSCGTAWCHVHWSGHVGYVNGDYLLTHATVIVTAMTHVHGYHAVHIHAPVVVHVAKPCRYLFC
jgi:uncharacterized protein YraI